MSLYNILHGQNPIAAALLEMLDVTPADFNRYRDAHLNKDGTVIIVYTRCGGGNRDDYFPTELTRHPSYIKDYDDDYDNTYAYIEFNVPTEYLELCSTLSTGHDPKTVHELFNHVVNDIEKNGEASEYIERSQPFINALKQMLESDTSGVIEI